MRKPYHLIAAAGIAMMAACTSSEENIHIIPRPDRIEVQSGTFKAAGAEWYCSPETDPKSQEAVAGFFSHLSVLSGKESKQADSQPASGFVFLHDADLPEEGYTIEVSRRKVEVKSSSFNGSLYAIETLKQLLPVEIYGATAAADAEWTLPCVTVNDVPRFGYRGLHIDVARHFFDAAEVKKILDIMAVHKLNTMHWHLTDDQGWRIEIKKYPELTAVGGWREGTVVRKEWDNYDGIRYGGYFTQDEIRDVIAHAASKGITVIPEIDLPGHMLAALTAYPKLGCTGGPYKVWGRWGVADDVLCAGKEETMKFLEDVLTEVAELFPSEYIHIGGDECPKVRWEKCPVCQKKIKELGLKDTEEYSAEHYLQSYVMERMEKFLAEKGKKVIGWDEILEGTPGPEAVIMSWRGSEGGIKASKMGHDVIMTPNTHFYFDYYQSRDVDQEPFGIGGYVPLEKVYSYEPFTEEMDDEARKHILGVQANCWSEYILSDEHLEYMILPRLAALSEVQWCRPENKDWDRFMKDMPHEISIYDIMGYNYAKTIFRVTGQPEMNAEKGCMEVRLSTYGDTPIRYTTDGTEPDGNSTLYTGPIEIRKGCTLKANTFREGMTLMPYVQEFKENKAMGKEVTLNTQPAPRYKYKAPANFTDGLKGAADYGSDRWAGWFGEPFSITIDMGGDTRYSRVTVGCMSMQSDDVFLPLNIKVSLSDDGENFTQAAYLDIPLTRSEPKNGVADFKIEFPETSARYLKVEAETVASMPKWQGRAGSPGFLFIDEVAVE